METTTDDTWADPVEQMHSTFTKAGLQRACFERSLSTNGDKRELASRLYMAGHTMSSLVRGKR